MNYKYSQLYYEIIELLENYGFPDNDILTDIFYKSSECDNVEYYFGYNDGNNYSQDSIYQILSLDEEDSYNVANILSEFSENDMEEFYPFAITESGYYLGITETEDVDAVVKLYNSDLNVIVPIYDECKHKVLLSDILNNI